MSPVITAATARQAVRFGVLLSTNRRIGESDADVFARTLTLTQAAESAGMDDLWVVEHHFADGTPCPSALSLAAFLLGRTRRIHVGTAVTLLPLHSPVHVAEQAALLDHLSDGRFVLGVGRGQQSGGYESVGGGIRYWEEGLAEALDLVTASWKGAVSAGTELYSFPSVTPLPRPRTPGGPPIYVAASSPNTARLAASRGLPMLMYFDKTAEYKAELVTVHGEAAACAGRHANRYDHAFAVYAEVTDSPRQAREFTRGRAAVMLRGANEDHRIGQVADRLLGMHPVGDAATCVERLTTAIQVSGCTRVLCHVEGGHTTTAVLRNLERLTTEVFPEVRARVAASAPLAACPVGP